jgi:lysophospholipase L1-like esterase
VENVVKFKRLKDESTGLYRNYSYPEYIGIPFHPGVDDYPYPVDAIGFTYDGLHPSDKGYQIIADMISDVFKKDGYFSSDIQKK